MANAAVKELKDFLTCHDFSQDVAWWVDCRRTEFEAADTSDSESKSCEQYEIFIDFKNWMEEMAVMALMGSDISEDLLLGECEKMVRGSPEEKEELHSLLNVIEDLCQFDVFVNLMGRRRRNSLPVQAQVEGTTTKPTQQVAPLNTETEPSEEEQAWEKQWRLAQKLLAGEAAVDSPLYRWARAVDSYHSRLFEYENLGMLDDEGAQTELERLSIAMLYERIHAQHVLNDLLAEENREVHIDDGADEDNEAALARLYDAHDSTSLIIMKHQENIEKMQGTLSAEEAFELYLSIREETERDKFLLGAEDELIELLRQTLPIVDQTPPGYVNAIADLIWLENRLERINLEILSRTEYDATHANAAANALQAMNGGDQEWSLEMAVHLEQDEERFEQFTLQTLDPEAARQLEQEEVECMQNVLSNAAEEYARLEKLMMTPCVDDNSQQQPQDQSSEIEIETQHEKQEENEEKSHEDKVHEEKSHEEKVHEEKVNEEAREESPSHEELHEEPDEVVTGDVMEEPPTQAESSEQEEKQAEEKPLSADAKELQRCFEELLSRNNKMRDELDKSLLNMRYEYEDSINRLKQDMIKKRSSLKRKLAKKRKERLRIAIDSQVAQVSAGPLSPMLLSPKLLSPKLLSPARRNVPKSRPVLERGNSRALLNSLEGSSQALVEELFPPVSSPVAKLRNELPMPRHKHGKTPLNKDTRTFF